jgi:acetyl esterase/lipase
MAFDLLAVTKKIRAVGHAADMSKIPELMGLYTEFHEKEPYQGVRVERDIAYGPDPRNRLDVFSDETAAGEARDVLVFIHGGGFVGGDKKVPGSPYHDNVALFAVRGGMVGVNMTYRLAPQHKWPSVIEDIAGAIEWVRKNVRAHGGNPERIFLFAASAGAVHAASYVTHSHLVGGAPIAGAILQSGIYDYTKAVSGQDINERAGSYLGTDQKELAERSSLKGLVETKTPVLYVLTEFDLPGFDAAHLLLIEHYAKANGRWPRFMMLMGHNHFTATPSLNTPDRQLGDQIVAFVDGVPR